MLRRSITASLIEWKNRPHHPLVLSGLRQTGKTYIVRDFGRQHYQHVVYLDLRANTSAHAAFEGDFNVDNMVLSITSAKEHASFVPDNTLLILDEIQDCPNARSSLKYWDMDGRFDVIATGSFLGVKGFREPYLRGIPVGYEEQMTLRPLSFREFLDNLDLDQSVVDHVMCCIRAGEPVLPAVHDRLRKLYYQYLIVGGMPEAINVFLATHNANEVRDTQRRIISSIRDDFGRYRDAQGVEKVNETLKLRAEACLESLPAQLAKEYKKFQYSKVNARGKSTDKAEGLHYLLDVGLVVRAHNLREFASPLEGAKIPSEFKAFFADTGLLISQLEPGTAAKVLSGDLSAYKGAIAENMVATSLVSLGYEPYYFHAPSGSPEIDFVFSYQGSPTLIECKSTNGRMTSMRYVLEHPKKYGVHPAIKFADANVGGGKGFVTLPLYALGFLDEAAQDLIIPQVNLEDLRI